MTESEPTPTVEEKKYSLKDIKQMFETYYEERKKREESLALEDPRKLDFKKEGEQIAEEYRSLMATLDLPFFVELQKCARDVYRVILSERPLDEELRMRPIEQRTFVLAGKNRKGKTADTIFLTHDKYYTDVPMRPEVLGIKKRELRIVEIHFLATSDRFFDEMIDDIKTRCNLKTPQERDLDMVSRLLDARVCEKVIGINTILISENQKISKDAEWVEKTADRRLYNKLERFLEDGESSGKVVKDSRFGNISIIPKSAMDVFKTIIILVGAYFLVGLILSFVFGVAVPGIGGGNAPPPSGPVEPDPYQPTASILFGMLQFLGLIP